MTDLAAQIDAAWDARADLTVHTQGEVREAVDAALALLDSGEQITFEALQLQLVVAAWESSDRNQLRTARYLNISRNVLRTYLKKAGVLA